MPGRTQVSHNTHLPISYRQTKHFYFIHNDQVHNVAECPSAVFKAAIEAAMDPKRLTVLSGAIEEAQGLLSGNLDLFARWWLLAYVALQHTDRPVKLYASREMAEQAVKVVGAAGG